MLEMSKSDYTDELRIEGINAKGFGTIPKFIMLDTDLSLRTKALYAYFCSFAGAGTTAFPSRGKIIRDLQIGKDSFYNALNALISQGYLTVEQKNAGGRGRGYMKNIYTLNQNMKKKLQDYVAKCDTTGQGAVIKYSGIKSEGFGTIPKIVMLDQNLTAESKAIYAYFCAFAGNGACAFPTKKDILHHLSIAVGTYHKHFNLLVKYDYIRITKKRSADGLFDRNEYIINDTPGKDSEEQRQVENDENQPCIKNQPSIKNPDTQNLASLSHFCKDEGETPAWNLIHGENQPCIKNQPSIKNPDTQKMAPLSRFCEDEGEIPVWNLPHIKNPDSQNPDSQISDTQNPDSQIPDTNINSIKINSIQNNQSINLRAKDRVMESENISDDDFIMDRLLGQKHIPIELLEDDVLRMKTAQLLSAWDVFSKPSAWGKGQDADLRCSTYRLYVSALTNLLNPNSGVRRLNGQYVSSAMILEQLDGCLEIDEDNSLSIPYLDHETACSDFLCALRGEKEVKAKLRYMESCIWTAWQKAGIDDYALFAKNF